MADFIARIKPKKSSVAGEVPLASDLEVAEVAVNTADGKLFVKHTDNTIKEISGSGGGTIDASSTVRVESTAVTTSSLAAGASEDVTLPDTSRAGQFLKVESTGPAWVVFYSSTAARTADAGRPSSDDPSSGSGVLMEVFFDQAETNLITPSILYFNDEPGEPEELYAKVTNTDSSAQTITITATVVPIEGRALVEAQGSARSTSPELTTSTLADGAAEFMTLGNVARSGQFITVETTHAARVLYYSSTAARTADAGRAISVDPDKNGGLLLEVATAGAEVLEISPSVLYHNAAGQIGEIYLKVENLSGGPAAIGVTTTVVPIEGRGVYASELEDLIDVDADNPADTNALIYDAASGRWVAGTAAADLSNSSINALADVDTSSTVATEGAILRWDSTASSWATANVTAVYGGAFSGGIPDITDLSNLAGFIFTGQSITTSGNTSAYDPTNTGDANWQAYFGDIAAYKPVGWETTFHQFVEGGAEHTLTASADFEHFSLDWTLSFFASNGCWSSDNSDIDLEFLDTNNNQIAVIRVRSSGNYKNSLAYGSSFTSLAYAPTCGSYPLVQGEFTFTPGQLIWTDTRACAGNGSNQDFTFNCNMASVTKIRRSYAQVDSNWTGGTCSALYRLSL